MRYFVLLVGVCGVASAALFARSGLHAGVSAVALSAWRLTIASAAFLLWHALFGRKDSGSEGISRPDAIRLLIAGVFLALHFGTWIASLEYVSVARSTLLVATSPLWAGLVGLFIPALRPKAGFWLGLAIGFAGAAMFIGFDAVAIGPQNWKGDVLAAIGAICIVPYLLLSQDVQRRLGTLRTITWIYTAAAGSLIVYLTASRSLLLPTSAASWISILGMALFAQLIGHSSLNGSLKFFSAAQVATATLLEPVFAAVLAWILLAERITLLQAAGGTVLLIGVAIGLRAEPFPVQGET